MSVSTWTRLRAFVDPLLPKGLYTVSEVGAKEVVGTMDLTVPELRAYLADRGYRPNPLSSAKRLHTTGQLNDLSMRRIPDTHPDAALGTRLMDWRPDQCQYHVHAFATDAGTVVGSHYELRPDFFRPRPNIDRLRTHYTAVHGREHLNGVTDLQPHHG